MSKKDTDLRKKFAKQQEKYLDELQKSMPDYGYEKERLEKKSLINVIKLICLTILGSIGLIGAFFGREGLLLIGGIIILVTMLFIMTSGNDM
jgi:hypothetical protein